MTQKFKVGDKVRIINAEAINGGYERWKNGEITEVVSFLRGYPQLRINHGRFAGLELVVTGSEFEYIEKVSTKKQRLSDAEKQLTEQATRIAELEAELGTMKSKVEALEKAQKQMIRVGEVADVYDNGTYIGKFPPLPQTPNEQRKAIIAEAKAFVEDTKNRTGSLSNRKGYYYSDVAYCICDVEFIVNAEKRTVVALLKEQLGAQRVLAKGIAKCAPDDVFNADIGKAIALGRALGLDVKRFEQAVKPTEVVVGHIVTFPKTDSWYMRHNYRVDSLKGEDNLTVVYNAIDGMDYRVGGKANLVGAQTLDTIIDDTEAQY